MENKADSESLSDSKKENFLFTCHLSETDFKCLNFLHHLKEHQEKRTVSRNNILQRLLREQVFEIRKDLKEKLNKPKVKKNSSQVAELKFELKLIKEYHLENIYYKY